MRYVAGAQVDSEFTTLPGTRIHAAVLGPAGARKVVCVHGLGCSHRYFLPFLRVLSTDLWVAAVDLPGFGRSPGPRVALDIRGLSLALADWLRATGRGGAALVANSNGCQVVVDLAVHSPELLGPVVLIGPTTELGARTVCQQSTRLVRDICFERPSLVAVVARDYLTCGPRRFAATLRHTLADPVERKLRHLWPSTVVVRGERDPIVPHAWALEVAERLPHARYTEVPDAGHAVNFSAPAALAHITRTLLADEPERER